VVTIAGLVGDIVTHGLREQDAMEADTVIKISEQDATAMNARLL